MRISDYRLETYACGLVLALFVILVPTVHVHAETATVTIEVIIVECNDGADNDSDGLTDYPNDPGCTDFSDDDETDPECIDGLDNDGDGLVDYPNDPGCEDANDNDETDPPESGEEGSVSGGSAGLRLLEPVARSIVFRGLAHSGGEVVLLKDGVRVGTATAEGDASFSMTLANVTAGQYIFTLYGIDTDGIRSGSLSFTVTITPSFQIDVSGIFIPPTIRLLEQETADTVQVSGQTAPDALVSVTVFVRGQSVTEVRVPARDDGHYRAVLTGTELRSGAGVIKSLAAVGSLESPFGLAAGLFPAFGERTPLRGDFNGDQRVSLIDFSMAAFWFKLADPPAQFDLNDDGVVDLVDLSIMVFNWTG